MWGNVTASPTQKWTHSASQSRQIATGFSQVSVKTFSPHGYFNEGKAKIIEMILFRCHESLACLLDVCSTLSASSLLNLFRLN